MRKCERQGEKLRLQREREIDWNQFHPETEPTLKGAPAGWPERSVVAHVSFPQPPHPHTPIPSVAPCVYNGWNFSPRLSLPAPATRRSRSGRGVGDDADAVVVGGCGYIDELAGGDLCGPERAGDAGLLAACATEEEDGCTTTAVVLCHSHFWRGAVPLSLQL